MYKHIIWDWNGTLLDDVKLCMEIMNNILKNNSMEILTLEKYKDIFIFPVRKYYERVGFCDSEFDRISIDFIEEYEKKRLECSLYRGVVGFLSKNVHNCITQSVLSAYKHSSLVEVIEHFSLSSYFTTLMGHGDIYAHGKIEQGRRLIQELGYNNKEILLIGDTFHDFEVAKEIGVECVLISHGHNSIKNLKNSNKQIVGNFEELDCFLWGERSHV